MIIETIPFTYCVTHKPSGRKYYGVRFKNGCKPSDLWNKYFTSSKVIHILIKKDGLSAFDIEIRKTFKTKEDAIEWEFKVLRRVKVVGRSEWINASAGKAAPCNGRKHDEVTREKMSLSQCGKNNGFYGKTHTPEAREKISVGNKGKTISDDHKRILSDLKKGKPFSGYGGHSEDAIQKRSKSNKGKKRTPEQKERMRQSHLGKTASVETKQKMKESQQKRRLKEREPS
jgi:hypothetical protein